jgi:hypothetical protein
VENSRSGGDSVLKTGAQVISLTRKALRNPEPEVELRDLLKDELVANFFRFVRNHDLRQEALEALEKRLGE